MTVDLLDQSIEDPLVANEKETSSIEDAGNKYKSKRTRKTAYFSDE